MFKTSAASVDFVQILDALHSSVVLLDSRRRIVCCNEPFARLVGVERRQDLVDKDFYATLQKPRFTDGDYCPLHFVATRGVQTRTSFVVPGADENDERFYEMIAKPFPVSPQETYFLVAIQDVTEIARDDRRLQRLSKTRAELFLHLDRSALRGDSVDVRKEKLRALVQKHMRATLHYDVCEMRLLDADEKLIPFLAIGIPPEAIERVLYASPSKNGITGYVASCGETYICDDVRNDPNYIVGAIDAASSITLPLLYLNKIVGVVNVESRTPNAFTRRDARYLELYLMDLAQALHRLELLETETVRVRGECAQELRDQYFGANVDVVGAAFERRVQKRPQDEAEEIATRFYAQGVRDASRRLKPTVKRLTNKWSKRSLAPPQNAERFEELQNRRVLLVDRDLRFLESRVDAFESYGLVVDVAPNPNVALAMLQTLEYDAVLSELYPDGEYFTVEEKDSARGVNEFGCNLFDVHLPNYDAPIAGNARDAEIRRRVVSDVARGKFDAYFFYEALQALNLERTPAFLVFLDDVYDPTHILRDLYGNLHFRPIQILKNSELDAQLQQLLKSVGRRDA